MNNEKNGLFNDELGGKIMIEFVALRVKTYSYSMYDGSEKKAKRTKKYATEIETKLNVYKYCLLNNKIILKSQQRFKSEKTQSIY